MESKRRFLLFLSDSELEWQASSGHSSAEEAQEHLAFLMRHQAPTFAGSYRIEGVVVESTVEGAFLGTGPVSDSENLENQTDAQDIMPF